MTPLPGLPPRSGTGLFLLSGGLLALGLLAGLARDKHWGEPTFPVLLDTDRAEGLRTGMAVRIAGLSVGTLRELTLQDNARVALRLEIAERHRRLIGPGSVAWQANPVRYPARPGPTVVTAMTAARTPEAGTPPLPATPTRLLAPGLSMPLHPAAERLSTNRYGTTAWNSVVADGPYQPCRSTMRCVAVLL